MVQILVGMKDEASNMFMEVSPAATTAAAIRRFANAVNESKFMQQNAKDFNLYFLGNWDTETGKIIGRENPEKIAEATEFVSTKKEENK